MSTNIRIYSNKKPDFVQNAFLLHSSSPKKVMLASPFFSNAPLIEDMVSKGCSVQLIVRLGEATSPNHLRRLIDNSRIQVRFFTKRTFHSKLYIFGSDAALVGSANLTDSGINSNQEICIEIPGGTDGFDRLVSIFQSYWNEAHVLTAESLENIRWLTRRDRQDLRNNSMMRCLRFSAKSPHPVSK